MTRFVSIVVFIITIALQSHPI